MSLPARLLRIVLIFTLLISLSPVSVFAQSSQPTYKQAEQASKQVQLILAGLGGTAICALSGIDVFHPGYNCTGQKIPTSQDNSLQTNPQSLGAIGFITASIGSLYQRPLTTNDSVRYLASNFGIAKKTLAQDSATGGFESFSFLQHMFLVIQNISYLLLVFAFILIGMAIMLRFKIDPRTVMTLQNQIPKIVVAVIMISFSYSIAGLLVDGMWVTTYFGINTIGGIAQNECELNGDDTNNTTFAGEGTQQILNNPVAFVHHILSNTDCFDKWSGLSGLSKDIGFSMSNAMTDVLLQTLGFDQLSDLNCGIGINIGPLGSGSVSDCLQKGVYSVLTFIIGIVALLIVLVAIFVALVRLWINLVKAYVYIILDVITAPLQILVGVLPGGRMGFIHWLRHITGHLLLFPASAIMIFLAISFALNKDLNAENPTGVFFPPLIGVGGGLGGVGNIIAFGLLMILPELLEMIKETMGIKSNTRAFKAVVGGLGRGVGPTKALGGMGAELFGKDKNNNSRMGRLIAGRAWTNLAGPASRLGNSFPMKHYYRTKKGFEDRKRRLVSQDKSTVIRQAEAYAQHQELYEGKDRTEAFNQYMDTHYYNKQGHASQATKSTNNSGTGQATPQTNTRNTSTHTSGSPASGASTTSGSSSSRASSAATPPSAGAATATSGGTIPTPKIKVKWFGDELKYADGTGDVIARKSGSSYTVGTEAMNFSEFNTWMTNHPMYEFTVS